MSAADNGRAVHSPGRAPSGRGPMGRGPMGMHLAFEKPKNFKGTLRRLLGYLRPHRWTLLGIAGMMLIATALSVIGPKILGTVTTRVFEGWRARASGGVGAIDFAAIGRTLLGLAGLYLVSAGFTYLQGFVMAKVAQRVAFAMREEISGKLARLPLKFYDGHSHGDVLSRVTNDVDTVGTTLQQSLGQLLSAVITIAGTLVMMLTISPLLTLIGALILPAVALAARALMARSKVYFTGQQKTIGELSGHIDEMFAGHKVVKAFGRERDSLAKFDAINHRLFETGWKAQFLSGLMMPLMGIINNLGYVAVCIVGGVLAARRALAVGDIQAFIQYLRTLSMPIMQTATMANVIQSTVAAAERVFELLDEPEEIPDAPEARRLAAPRGQVGFREVRFSYQPEVRLIEGMTVDVAQGQTVAIVGPTGAGKTTLVNLLMRFYDVDGGTITVDGVDIRQLPRTHLRSMFGMVLQDTWLFQGTIRDNIAFGRAGATPDEVVAAAKAAHADHFIRTLPQGYDTLLLEDGSNISQGQKQLLTIARAILANPTVLIFDEATSSVDTRTELHIQRAMQRLMNQRTSFVVAHRLSTIRDADLILVMNEGRLVEHGRHHELLERGGFYADLYQAQFAGPETSEPPQGASTGRARA
jgi:ATP-binding cassette subfamily B multidrug efflux pump